MREEKNKVCPICGVKFPITKGNHKYCSPECSAKARYMSWYKYSKKRLADDPEYKARAKFYNDRSRLAKAYPKYEAKAKELTKLYGDLEAMTKYLMDTFRFKGGK